MIDGFFLSCLFYGCKIKQMNLRDHVIVCVCNCMGNNVDLIQTEVCGQGCGVAVVTSCNQITVVSNRYYE